MDQNITAACGEDIFLWPDGTRCYREEYERDFSSWCSDDYEVVPFGSARWKEVDEASL